MKSGIEKCAMLITKSRKQQLIEELPNQEKIPTLGEMKIYKYLGILEIDTIKHTEMKEKIKKEYLRIPRKLLETKPNSRNLTEKVNIWAVHLVRYLEPFLKWTREKLQQMEQRTRKLTTMHKALHPRDRVDRLYMSKKKKEEEDIPAFETASMHRFKKRRGRLITATRNNTANRSINGTKITVVGALPISP